MNYDIETVEIVRNIKKSRSKNIFFGYKNNMSTSYSYGYRNIAYGYKNYAYQNSCGINGDTVEDMIKNLKDKIQLHLMEILD
jgi:hypothetical protein